MPCRLATAATGSRSASRMIATICSSVKRALRIAPSEPGASLSRNRRSEIPGADQSRSLHPHPAVNNLDCRTLIIVKYLKAGLQRNPPTRLRCAWAAALGDPFALVDDKHVVARK